MSRLDTIHNAVKSALVKDGWSITADPYTIVYEDLKLFADLAAERPLAAERAGERIVVEVKSFLGPSPLQDLKLAVGQYAIYRSLLRATAPERQLYLAISDDVFSEFFERDSIRFIVRENQLALLTIDPRAEEVVRWIK